MRWRLTRVPPRTLRGRLITGLVALLAIACATVGVVTYFSVQGSLSRELGNQLQTATSLANKCLDAQLAEADGDNQAGAAGQAGTDGTAPPAAPAQGPDLYCDGLGNGTLLAYVKDGQWHARLIPASTVTLSAADERTLLGIRPSPPPGQNGGVPTTTANLPSAGGEFALTALKDPDGAIYITGLSLSNLHDTLRDVALTESVVFGGVLLLAGVLGTLWVRLSLRPLRRVAATASQVAELPLESGEVELPAGVPVSDSGTETGQVGLAFNRMLGHVQAALKRRAASEARLRRFAADASHELRTPLAAIRGYAELARRHPGPVPDDIAHALARVESESARMSVLVDELLLLAQLDAGRPLAKEPVDLTRLAIDATSDARAASQDHRWVLELPDEPVLVEGDEHRLHQVLANLMSNAAKHTPQGTTVTVSLTTSEDPPTVRMSVTDSGPGIPAELQPALFERFVRGDTARSNAGTSTGLGLAIVQAVTTAHGGSVSVTSRPGHTSFVITLPRLTSVPASA